MIIIPSKNILIITPPKCGSTSLNKYFCEDTKQGFMVVGPQGNWHEEMPNPVIDKHTFYIPYGYRGYNIYVAVRNPRDRFISLYHHYCRWIKDVPFDWYVEAWSKLYWFYAWPLSKLCEPIRGCNALPLPIETINQSLVDLGFEEPKVPHEHIAPNKKNIDFDVPRRFIQTDVLLV